MVRHLENQMIKIASKLKYMFVVVQHKLQELAKKKSEAKSKKNGYIRGAASKIKKAWVLAEH
jgi:hypothetical protein